MKLILNADDFGLTETVNHGIVECFKAGVVKVNHHHDEPTWNPTRH